MNKIKDLPFSATYNNYMSEYESWSEALDNVHNIREKSAVRLRPQKSRKAKKA